MTVHEAQGLKRAFWVKKQKKVLLPCKFSHQNREMQVKTHFY
jgi:hypothetical protein